MNDNTPQMSKSRHAYHSKNWTSLQFIYENPSRDQQVPLSCRHVTIYSTQQIRRRKQLGDESSPVSQQFSVPCGQVATKIIQQPVQIAAFNWQSSPNCTRKVWSCLKVFNDVQKRNREASKTNSHRSLGVGLSPNVPHNPQISEDIHAFRMTEKTKWWFTIAATAFKFEIEVQ